MTKSMMKQSNGGLRGQGGVLALIVGVALVPGTARAVDPPAPFPWVADEAAAQFTATLPLLAHGGLSTARAGLSGWFDRQADLRDTRSDFPPASGGGVWTRIQGGRADYALAVVDQPDAVNDWEQDTYALLAGADVLTGTLAGGRWLLGLGVGYVRTKMSFEELGTEMDYDSVGVTAYTSWFGDDFFVDAMLRYDWLSPDLNAPVLDIYDSPLLSTDMKAFSLGVEGGLRFGVGVLRVEPLAGVQWVRLATDSLNLPPHEPVLHRAEGHAYMLGTQESRRASAGLRLSIPHAVAGLNLEYALTGRYWREFERDIETTLRITEPAQNANLEPIRVPVADVGLSQYLESGYSEVVAGIAVNSASGHMSTLLNATGHFGSDYDAWGVTLGFRYQW